MARYLPIGKNTPAPVGKLPIDKFIANRQACRMTLEQYLTENGLKPTVFAAEIGVAASTITRLLRRERSPRLELIALICEKTNGAVSWDSFLPEATNLSAPATSSLPQADHAAGSDSRFPEPAAAEGC